MVHWRCSPTSAPSTSATSASTSTTSPTTQAQYHQYQMDKHHGVHDFDDFVHVYDLTGSQLFILEPLAFVHYYSHNVNPDPNPDTYRSE